jgi:hypothetical protein
VPEDELNNGDTERVRVGRIPRAPNLKFAKKLLKRMSFCEVLPIDGYRSMAKSVLDSDRSQYINEYLKFLGMLGFIRRINKVILVSENSQKIGREFTDDDALTLWEMKVFRERLINNDNVRWFIEVIFGYDIANNVWLKKKQSLTPKEIAEEYLKLSELSTGTSRREARFLTNWLGQVGLVEQSYAGKYYLTVGHLNFEKFEKVLKEKYDQLEAHEHSGIKWVEVAPIQASTCEEYNIPKQVFDDYFKCLIEQKEGSISVSPGSAGLKDVKKFGVKINNRLIYYMRYNR